MAFFSEKKCVQIHYSLKLKFFKKHFILNMDSEEGLAAAVVVCKLEKEKKEKTEKNVVLG